jgi:hypothetical protein
MAVESSAELLAFCQDMSGLPTVNEEMDSTKWFRLLTLAQKELFHILASHVAGSQYGAPELMTTADGGYTYTFASYPWGRAEIRQSRTGALLVPGSESDYDADFVAEGQTIRWVNDQSRTFSDGPYARYAPEPGDISASTQPTLKPPSARVLICWRALETWSAMGARRDPAFYAREYQKGLFGDPMTPGSVGLIPALKVAYQFAGGVDGPMTGTHWSSQIMNATN